MADQRPWIKLWKSFRHDPAIQALSLDQLGRWVLLLLFVADEGQDGVWRAPALVAWQRLASSLRAAPQRRSGDGMATLLHAMPGVKLQQDSETVTVTFINWRKYQVGLSTPRTRRWRDQRSGNGHAAVTGTVTGTPDPSRSGTKKRREVEENPLTPVATHVPETHRQLGGTSPWPEPEPDAHTAPIHAILERLNGQATAKPDDPPF